MFTDKPSQALEALDTFLGTLPCSASALWLRMTRQEPFVLVTSSQTGDDEIPLLLPAAVLDALPAEADLLRLPAPIPTLTMPALFRKAGVLLPLRRSDGSPHALLWCQPRDGTDPDTLSALLGTVTPLLEAALAGVMTSVTLGELWSLSSSPSVWSTPSGMC